MVIEMAIVLPVLLLVIFGLIDLGRAFTIDMALTQAAREGARVAALGGSDLAVQLRTEQASTFPGGDTVTATVTVNCPPVPTPDDNAAVMASYSFQFITPLGAIADLFQDSDLGTPITLSATGVMRCGG